MVFAPSCPNTIPPRSRTYLPHRTTGPEIQLDLANTITMSIPTENTSIALPESRQDANLASTQASRPGNTVPAGVSTEHPSTAPFVDSSTAHTTNDKSLSDSVKNSLDSVAQQTPTTQSVTDQLPSAQQATDALKAGASSLVAGISSLAFGVSDAATKNAADTHPESEKARNVDDLHIPGAFESATSDREDIADVQRGVQSVSDSLPSSQQVKQTIPGISSRSGNEQIHKDGTDYIKSQLENRNINSVGVSNTCPYHPARACYGNEVDEAIPCTTYGTPDILANFATLGD